MPGKKFKSGSLARELSKIQTYKEAARR